MPVASLPGVDTYYEVAGEGPPLLAINGSGSDLRRKPGLLDSPLTKRFTVLTYDHRGLGRSVPADPEAQPTMAEFAADALALCAHLGWERFSVLGISFGGMTAQEVAIADAAGDRRIDRLVLACSSPGGSMPSAPLHALYPLPLAERAGAMADVNDLRCATDPERRAAIVGFLTATGTDDPIEPGLVRQLEARRHHDTFDRLPTIAVPTLVAAGRHDGIAPLANNEAIAAQIPGAQLQVFEGGHAFMLEDRTAFGAMGDFLLA